MQAAPVCEHCGFRLGTEDAGPSAVAILDDLDQQADEMLARWTNALLDNLAGPTAQESLALLDPPARTLVDEFVTGRQLPPELPAESAQDLIDAIARVLAGLEKVSVKPADLCAALAPGGAPATPAEIKKRLAEYLDEQARGKDPAKVRIVLEAE